MRLLTIGAIVMAAVLGASQAAAATSYDKLFVFGDSLVDSGNARAARLASGGADPAPPALGYFQGRFSNGYNFADDLSLKLGLGPATASLLGGSNFSVGGAQAAEVATDESPSFAEQLAVFEGSGQSLTASSLVLVTFGGNDVRAELAKAATIAGYTPNLNPALAALNAGLTSLINDGARNIIVTGLPDIGQIPAVTGLNSAALSNLGTQLSLGLNNAYGASTNLLASQTGYNLKFFNFFAYQQAIYADPVAFGLPAVINKTDACLSVPGAGPACNGYVYFDTIHPTAPIHSVLADGIFALAVPEPATWVMLVAGFGMAGGAVRRRRVAAA